MRGLTILRKTVYIIFHTVITEDICWTHTMRIISQYTRFPLWAPSGHKSALLINSYHGNQLFWSPMWSVLLRREIFSMDVMRETDSYWCLASSLCPLLSFQHVKCRRKTFQQFRRRWQRASGPGLHAFLPTGVYQPSHGISSKNAEVFEDMYWWPFFSPRLVLRLVSWYEITKTKADGYAHFTVNRDCVRALQPHSTLHYSSEALHRLVSRINKYEHDLIHCRWCGVGFLDLQCASRLVLALRRLSVHIQRVVDCKPFVLLLFSAIKLLIITSYTASAQLVPKQHRATVHIFSFTCRMTSLMRSWIGWLVGGVAQYPRWGIV